MKKCEKEELIEGLRDELKEKYPDRVKMSELCEKIESALHDSNLPIPMQIGSIELVKHDLMIKGSIAEAILDRDKDLTEKVYEKQLSGDE